MKRTVLMALMAAVFALPSLALPKIVAHRGFWRTDGSAQNSLTALLKADEIGCYGSEFDVWITKDGVPVVFHDAVWQGLRIEDATYPELQYRQLGNGEFLPTLQQYLQLGKTLPGTQLILEIKTHSSNERNARVTKVCVDLVKQLGLEKQVEYIAFSKYVCEQLHQLTPASNIAYLNGDLAPAEVAKMGINGIDYNLSVFEKHPEWLDEAARNGIEVNVWTVDGEELLTKHVNMKGIDIITTNDPDKLKAIIQKKK